MGEEFYLEIGTEEIPAGYILPAVQAMAAHMVRFLDEHRITHGEPYSTGTPRRLVLLVPDVAPRQEACITEILGPSRQVAFDAEGQATKAALGFAKGQGVNVEDLQIKETPKGEYLCVTREEQGLPTKDWLEKMLPDFIAHIPFPKSMRWGALAVTFARPIHSIVALLGFEVLQFAYGDVKTGNLSMGHRFMSPQRLPVREFAGHRENLRKHYVIVDFQERKQFIRESVQTAANQVHGQILEDEDLLEEVTNLVEHPRPIVGQFEDKYLRLPPEVPITVMREHQRYFAVVDRAGKLMPYFVTAANTIPRNRQTVSAGNARVIRARLEDARFYYDEDQKVPLAKRAEVLKEVVFHSKLGTSWEKVERFTALARWLGEQLDPQQLAPLLRAAYLCKADLTTGMVSEFPELQGVMGRDYARRQGEPEAVAQAIYEHYLPKRAGGPLPAGMLGALLSIADKLDTIVGCFGVGLLPTGTADPFALRRQTLGIIRIVLEKNLNLSLGDLIDQALQQLAGKITEPAETVKTGVLEFFRNRLLHQLDSQEGFGSDVIEAALDVGIDNLLEAVKRTKAVALFKARPDFESLAAAFKRVVNIIKEETLTTLDSARFTAEAETALYQNLQQTEQSVAAHLAQSDYDAALSAMAGLKAPIDAFFESVLVMDPDDSIRNNRLALLTRIRDLFAGVADFRKIQTTG
jgi:glycyl-tRNA synthetase beta chain